MVDLGPRLLTELKKWRLACPFSELDLVQFSGIDDRGNYLKDIDPDGLKGSDYACGLFQFTK